MIKKLNNSKGITLIALVITIIVLLILAGVAISMLSGDNGILKQAADAKTETELKTEAEQVKLAAMAALTAGEGNFKSDKALETLNQELSKIEGYNAGTIKKEDLPKTIEIAETKYTIEESGAVTIRNSNEIPVVTDVSKLTTKVEEKTIYEDKSAVNTTTKRAVIPKGFKVSSVSAEQHIDTGLVVIAEDGSEFVWVPVDDITTMYETLEDGKKVGQLYDWENLDAEGNPNKIEYSDIGFREPTVLYNTNNTDDSKYGVELSTLQNEFNEMIKYVEEAKGFYVGRYETSWNETTNKVQSVGNVTPACADGTETKMWYGLYEKQKLYGNHVVGSSMIWGSQYDQMMLWMNKNGYTVTSNNPKEGVSYNDTPTTGKENNPDVMNNVNDLISCHYEWTIEGWGYDSRVNRGDYYTTNSAGPSSRVRNRTSTEFMVS